MVIYHNPRCSKSRAGLDYLKSKTTEFEVVDYLKINLTEKKLRELILKLNMAPSSLVRTTEDYYKKELKGKNFTDDEWIIILLENPKLIQRPIVESRYKAIIARPPAKIDELF